MFRWGLEGSSTIRRSEFVRCEGEHNCNQAELGGWGCRLDDSVFELHVSAAVSPRKRVFQRQRNNYLLIGGFDGVRDIFTIQRVPKSGLAFHAILLSNWLV